MSRTAVFRYLWLVSAPRIYLRIAFAVIALTGVAIEFVNTGSSDFAIVSILLVQLFAASTGFVRFSSRGYYDPVLTSGASRAAIGATHFLASSAPGVAAWIIVGLAEVVFARTFDVMAFRPGGWISLLLVSTIPWALTVRLPPLSGGAIWMVASIAFLTSRWGTADMAQLRQLAPAVPSFWRSIRIALAVPLMLPALPVRLAVILGLLAIVGLAFGFGLLLIVRAEFPLVEETA